MSREYFFFRVHNGKLVPATPFYESRMQDKKYKNGDLIKAKLTKPRKAGTNKNAHQIGKYMTMHHDSFTHMSAHTALKYLQIKSRVACDVFGKGDEAVVIPWSLEYDSMDEGDFTEAIRGICRYISEHYWPDMTPEQIQMQSERFVDE